jgi:TRAP-type C4-dicarboxylate transport system permease small subunit
MKVLSAASTYVNRLVEVAVFVMLAVMVMVISAAVFWRYVLNDSLSWSEELGRYLLVWISFLGASMGTYQAAHISISMVTERLPPRIRWATELAADLMVVAFLAAILYQSIKILPVMSVRIAPTLGIRMSVVYAVLPLSSAVMLLHMFTRCASTLSSWRAER